MTEEEYFRKHYPDVCYNGKPLSPYWDLFQDGVEFGERQSEKKIEELEKENAILKGRNKGFEQQIMGLFIKYEEVYKRFPDLKGAMDKALDLQKENAELKKRVDNLYNSDCWASDQLTKATEIIKSLLSCCRNYPQENAEKIKQAEQFLQEIEK